MNAAFVVVLIGIAIWIKPKISTAHALDKQHSEIQKAIQLTRQEISKVRENQRRFRTDPEFLEALARENHLAYPGELIFIFDD